MTESTSIHPVQRAAHRSVGAFVDELARSGLRHVVFCPGSRSTPLVLLLAEHGGFRLWTHVDERSAAFFALGLAKGTGEPAALVATSGTAAANFLPAVTEAYFGRVPLLLLTADRPPEMRDVGTNQTIHQAGLFGRHVKWSVDMPLPDEDEGVIAYGKAAAARAVAAAVAPPAGPVQLNFPFREPLIPLPEADETERKGFALPPRAIRVRRGVLALSEDEAKAFADAWTGARRPLIVAGPDTPKDAVEGVLQLAARIGAPVLADPLSGVRTAGGSGADVVDAYDVFLRWDQVGHALPPSHVLRFGGMPVSKPLHRYLQFHRRAVHVVVDEGGGWRDPFLTAAEVIHADAARLCQDVLEAAAEGPPPRPNPWPGVWRRLNELTRETLEEALAKVQEPFEGLVAAALAELPLQGVHVYVGNSMPVRDMDSFFPATEEPVAVYGNRGVSGIDGLVSSALGVAAGTGEPTLLWLGDLSFYHDLNGLLAAALHDVNLTVVLVHNDGGGIFSFLPQAEHGRHFEALFGTPTGLDFEPVVGMYGGRFVRTALPDALKEAVAAGLKRPGLDVVEYRTNRRVNAAVHRGVMEAVGRTVVDGLGDVFRSSGGGR